MTQAEIASLWVAQGGAPALAPTMSAIAMAESSGNPTAHNRNTDGSIDRGLWQINSTNLPALGLSPTSVYDPQNNANAAIALASNARGLANWSAYNSGAYRRYLTGSQATTGTSRVMQSFTQSTNDVFKLFDSFLLGNTDVLTKALVVCFVLCILACISATQKFAGYAAAGLLFLLLIQKDKATNA